MSLHRGGGGGPVGLCDVVKEGRGGSEGGDKGWVMKEWESRRNKKCWHSRDGKGSKEDGKEWEEEGDGRGW